MNDQLRQPVPHHDAIDIGDFVFAATGARVRRLTTPEGEHWFPAADVCRELGYTTTRKALNDHVPERFRRPLETVTGGHSSRKIAGQNWRRNLQMVNLQGLLLLVTGFTKPACEPFKEWMLDVIVTIQREGSYSLPAAELQPAAPGAPVAYAVPAQVADAIVRLEERALRDDAALAALQREANAARREMADALRSVADVLGGIRDRLGPAPAPRVPRQRTAPRARERGAEELLAGWRERLTVTDDVWAVAVLLAPALVTDGQVNWSVDEIAARTGLSSARVHDSLRFLLRRHCIRQIGILHNAPVYALH
ncbi:BRO-N domain-containing protein [Streptomyces sp. XC 2026]|uniref:BRO-N domain-containing protein n=1 Tax=Streptomyces sp. XC 2026 TaxID=2782004 RepID=UPI001905DC64|nr:Bro-N domain-containing protein [Streptomyces sp. XC 2026]QQN78509.1 Bro-N domain-containing protein [Streptomyces sp. XC 2026]